MILYRLAANTIIVYLTAPAFDSIEDGLVTKERALVGTGVALGVAVVSLIFTVISMEPAYRHTFYRAKSGKAYCTSQRSAAAPKP